MQVVTDTGPVHYLVLIESAHILPAMFGSLLLPAVVRGELAHREAPFEVRKWIDFPPPWLKVHPVPALEVEDAARVAIDNDALDKGEKATIALAVSVGADLVLMDDRAGVTVARKKGLAVTGTVGVLQSVHTAAGDKLQVPA